ncbi:ABC transporter ATP-binding protein [Pseudomonas fluorescens]|uniref:Spermidine/putrescine import ATP-binding protein PotA n=1 Tax=Pseudomonas fluorescens TaxID=294 RepID=A0A5E6ZSE3_PSEFL|nr:ABC transporter ATP-binding protein [Pseudomonas fluorescens]VVN66877.1 Spermidine/putrescine import ATP-binding protein PotA [Pseudomonas fluorescens]VVP73883.1 Spermidine/putrescine import ATP-binding protein PotA [Pseudomonas fluorescens]
MAFLTLEGIVKTYGSFRAIDGLNLEVRHGEFIALLGPSGCGKTTTLQSIAGFVQPTEGRIVLDGRDITHVRPEQRGLGIVFQSYALFPHMSVAQNISFGLEMRGVPKAERSKRIDEALDLVRLGGLGERYPKALSGGQRQRVAIARALAIRPNLLLLDEPMSNLDAKLREEMHIELRAIQRDLGITTILVTHDQVEAMTMSDRIAVMQKGRIVQIDTPYEAYERPHSPFASAFLGKTNAFAGAVQTRNARCCNVQVKDTLLHVPHEDRSLGNDVNVYIRPEKIRLAQAGTGRLHGRVRLRVFLGNLWLIAVETSFGVVHMTQPNLGTPPPDENSEVGLDWSDDDLRLLDREVAHGQV